MNTKEFWCHNDVISEFNNRLTSNIFTLDNITTKKKAIKINDTKLYGYFLEKSKRMYFCPDELFEDLPFRIVKSTEVDYRSDVFEVITEAEPITIPSVKRMEYRELVDWFTKTQHTNKLHQKLYTIISTSAWIDRHNTRISTEAGFGKDSIVDLIGALVDTTCNIYGASFAKLEYNLKNEFIVLNEMGNLKAEDKSNMQEFLLATGAYRNIYTKRTRKSGGTQEQYDISKTSLMIIYNLPEYYRNKAQEYFDQMFTPAVINRFIPFVFEGRLTTKFQDLLDPIAILDEYEDTIKDIIATLQYYKYNKATTIDYEVPSIVKFSTKLERYERSFNVIMKYVSLYAKSQEEFTNLVTELFKAYKKYDTLLEGEKKVEELK